MGWISIFLRPMVDGRLRKGRGALGAKGKARRGSFYLVNLAYPIRLAEHAETISGLADPGASSPPRPPSHLLRSLSNASLLNTHH